MGSITFQVIGSAAVGTKTKTYAVSNGDIDRLVTCWQTLGATQGAPSPTIAQALLAWADGMMSDTKSTVLQFEREAAAAAIAPIVAT